MSTTSTIRTVKVVPSHITIDDKGIARIDGTRMKVIHIAKEWAGNHLTIEQMKEYWPHLSLAQIHSALAYYYDHQREIDAQIDRDLRRYHELLEEQRRKGSPVRDKLRELGHLK
jgi:uncharacterized protein (DUF433 family)